MLDQVVRQQNSGLDADASKASSQNGQSTPRPRSTQNVMLLQAMCALMSANSQPRFSTASSFLLAGIECLIRIAPIGLMASVHTGASMKAGHRFIVDNDRTQNAEAAYSHVGSVPLVFHIYSLVVAAICIVL